MRKTIIQENGIVVGNIHDKRNEKNPFYSLLLKNYYKNLDDLVKRVSPQTIHEVGCGEGHVISRYLGQGRLLSASDFSKSIIKIAHANYGAKGILFTDTSVYDLSGHESAELILCCEVLEHLEYPDLALKKIRDIATPYAIFAVPMEPIWRVMNILRGAYLKNWGNTPGHIQHWNINQLVCLLQANFKIIEIKKPFPWIMVLTTKKHQNA